ncbi:hypothetical protein QAD02_023443 [Eretmocerus hayati]|uniref:Uncharacterized protein n=1 Tax=Eretmocerus hayati TaxID=131215 RepID=A0ACC2PYB8_9HYME|nr:hypothetical protein QAD02_023443 [Eretmocerus hayati]
MQQHSQARAGARREPTQGPIVHQQPSRATPVSIRGNAGHPRKYLGSWHTTPPLNHLGFHVVATMAEAELRASAKFADATATKGDPALCTEQVAVHQHAPHWHDYPRARDQEAAPRPPSRENGEMNHAGGHVDVCISANPRYLRHVPPR